MSDSERPGYPHGRAPRPPIRVTLSTASVYPELLAAGFETAAATGYDGVEVMVTADPLTQRAEILQELSSRHGMPIDSIHAPCLLISARVWGVDPLVKLSRSIELAERVGARVVVVHPPFVWQRAAAADFTGSVAELQTRTEVRIAVENMFPLTVGRGRFSMNAYRPHWNPVPYDHRWFTLDLSHTATAGIDAIELFEAMGDRLGHLHLADGSGSGSDEHLVPGRGTQPGTWVLEALVRNGYDGSVCLEINTRGLSKKARLDDVRQSLAYARLALGQ
ncbi:sugar phosphate isomerase/epimerase [Nakamurella sp. A5-74]|uniref:Sugar phosphate isomerase/epimerase n=1 Tax=Nakamurella sp. A5-74 TaxID=3158264 RepID=A0AAU8DN34_9ACTN